MICKMCNASFVVKKLGAIYCSSKCRKLWHWHNVIKPNMPAKTIPNEPDKTEFHRVNIFKVNDRSNYYRGKGQFGYTTTYENIIPPNQWYYPDPENPNG